MQVSIVVPRLDEKPWGGRSLERFGWGPVLVAGLVLMGVPGILYGLSDGLAAILGLSALRGVGFGVLTVTGSAAVAALVDPRRRGGHPRARRSARLQ